MRTATLLILTACSDPAIVMPDAPIPTVHDIRVSDCSWKWGAETRDMTDVSSCEYACRQVPTPKPCTADAPCLDHAACMGAMDGHVTFDCPSTFVIDDWQGKHRGCCAVTYVGFASATFFECPRL